MHRAIVAVLVLASVGPAVAQAPAPAASPSPSPGEAAFQAQDWAKAAPAYEALVRAKPDDAQARFRLGVSLHGLGRFADAVTALEAAERLGATAPAAQFRLAKAYARTGRVADARRALLRAAERGFFAMPALESDVDLASVRSDPGYAEVKTAVDHNARPCVYGPEHRAFDFWVGEWDVRPTGAPDTTPPSKSRIELVEDRCVIAEHYEAPGYSGRSYNVYDATDQRWEQFWVDNKGARHHYRGQARDGNVYYEADDVHVFGTPGRVKLKMTFFSQGPDQVRQLGEQSSDGGKTYTVSYDLTYKRRKPAS
jgi:tetratricopeptide (TPR) repeat protein